MRFSDISSKFGDYLRQAFGTHSSSGVSADTKLASIQFASNRGDYYLYLADTIEATRGRKGLIDIFNSDVERYKKTARGKLSMHWARKFDTSGGNLKKTFAGTIPLEDAVILDTLQQAGGEKSLENALRDLADNSTLIAKARNILLATMASSLVVMLMTLLTVILMPMYTVPKITEIFSMLPFEDYPPKAAALVNFAAFVKNYALGLTAGFFALIVAVVISLPLITGPARKYFDKYGLVWGLYRDFQSIRFLSTLAALVRKSGNATTNLQEAIDMQKHGASRWKKYHLNKMGALIGRGVVGPELFATGIMDQKMEWYLADLIESRGIAEALQFVKDRLKERVIKRITVQSLFMAWTLMMGSMAASGYLLFWHMEAVDGLRRALQMYVS
jgi:hypothetical protein